MNRRRRKTKRVLVLAALAWIAGSGEPISGAFQGEPLPEQLSISASLRTRWELWNWFEPTGTEDNDYDFLATVARLGAMWKQDAFEVFVEAQNPALIDLPTSAIAAAPQGPLGLGAVYFQHN
jgi:hypothetical protein